MNIKRTSRLYKLAEYGGFYYRSWVKYDACDFYKYVIFGVLIYIAIVAMNLAYLSLLTWFFIDPFENQLTGAQVSLVIVSIFCSFHILISYAIYVSDEKWVGPRVPKFVREKFSKVWKKLCVDIEIE